MTVKINIDNRTIVRVLAVVILFMLGLQFLSAVRYALTLIFVAMFLAMALNPPVSYLSSRITKGSRGAATGIAYLSVLSIIGLFLWAIVPPLASQTVNFLDNIPEYVDDITSGEGAISDFIREYNLDEEINDFGRNLADDLGDTSGAIFSGVERVGQALISLFTVLVLTFFMLVEGPEWLEKLWQAQPDKSRKHRKEIARKMYSVVTGYVNGQLLIALIASFTSLVAMLVVGLDYALPLAGAVGLFGLIPMVGATLGSVVVIVVALFNSLTAAIIMLVFFLTYQQIENSFIQPYIQSRTLDVSPLLVLVSVIFGFSIGGMLGGFVAIPAAACGKILLNDYYDHKAGLVK